MLHQKIPLRSNRQILLSVSMLIIAAIACTSSPSPDQQPSTPARLPTEPLPTTLPDNSVPTDQPPTEPVPTTVPDNPVPTAEIFSIQGADSVAPDDVLHEVAFGTTGNNPYCRLGNYGYPTIDEFYTPERADWLEPFSIVICGLKPDEEMDVVVTFPDGTNTETLVRSPYAGSTMLIYPFSPSTDEQNGLHIFRFSGISGQVEHSVNVSTPNEPRIYFVDDVQSYYLYGFSPQERIRFFWYNTSTSSGLSIALTAWKDYVVDDRGHILIKVDTLQGIHTAIGDISGPARNAENILLPDPSEFIRSYFTDICVYRTYDYYWTLLTDRFRGSSDYASYVEWWDSVERVEIEKVNVLSLNGHVSSVYVQLTFRLKNGASSTSAIDYDLIFNEELHSWQFDRSSIK